MLVLKWFLPHKQVTWENELGWGAMGGWACVTLVFTGSHEPVFTQGARKSHMCTDKWNFHVL